MTSLSPEREELLRRLHSAAALLPLGVFFLAHVWINARALQGDGPFQDVTLRLSRLPGLVVVEVILVWIPLLFHVGYGVRLMLRQRTATPRSPFDRPGAAKVQRFTGVVVLVFLLVHLWQFRIGVALGRAAPADLFPLLCDRLSTTTRAGIPVNAALYLAGVAATSYHFANGILGSCFTFGWASTAPRARAISAVCTGIGLATFLVAANTVVYFATGAPWPGGDELPLPADGVGTIRMGATSP